MTTPTPDDGFGTPSYSGSPRRGTPASTAQGSPPLGLPPALVLPGGRRRRRGGGRRWRLPVALGAVVLAAAGVFVSCQVFGDSPEQDAAQSFLDAVARGDVAAASRATTESAAARRALPASLQGMAPAKASFDAGDVSNTSDASARVGYDASWRLPRDRGEWRYSGTLDVRRVGSDDWRVVWKADTIAPGLRDAEHLSLVSVQPPRASLNDRDGKALFTEQPVVTVGIDPTQVRDLRGLSATLGKVSALQSTAAEIEKSVRAVPKGTRFVPIITLRRPAYDKIRGAVRDLPGTAFQERDAVLSPRSGFASALLGSVGPATAEQVADSKGELSAEDEVGQGGLQERFNDTLTGMSGYRVLAVDGETGEARRLATPSEPRPGKAVTLTLDRTVQRAADDALDNVPLPAAIVVTSRSTGQILAVANSAASPGNIALNGQYPPGSVFKIASFASLFTNAGLKVGTPVDCPGKILVNGQTIQNENAFDKGRIDFGRAFAFSCNTTTARLALARLKQGQLATTAALLGLGQKWDLPLDSFSGSIPPAAQSNELAAEAYGQGRTLVSPLLMSEIVAAASTGRAIAPTLVAGKTGARIDSLSPAVTADMRRVMRGVVTVPGATGRILDGLPGDPGGKTGTAEYGNDKPPKAHSWFAGTRGDLAFSVLVENGEFTPHTGVVVARRLLERIPVN